MDIKELILGKEGAQFLNSNAQVQTCSVKWQKSPEQKRAEQLKKRAVAAAIRRANETPEQTAERRRKNRERQRKNRAETLRKSLAIHTGSDVLGPTNIKSITGKRDACMTGDDNGLQSYTCIACKANYDNPIKYFEHIQQQCLNFYLEQPEVFSKILALVKSKMNEIQKTEQLSKPGNGTVEEQCIMCGESFLFFTASTLSLPESLCPACRKSRPVANTQAVSQHSKIPEGQVCETTSKTGKYNANDMLSGNNIEESSSHDDVKNQRSVSCDLIEGAVPPKKPLLKCETELSSYLWPKQIPFPIKAVRLCYSKNEPYKKHHCWECDSPILPTSKRFIDHFKMMYECQWCIYTTHCHQASIDHVMRMHSGKEEDDETKYYPEDSYKSDNHTMQVEDCDDDLHRPTVKLEPPDLDEDFLPEFKSNNTDTRKSPSPLPDPDESDKEIVPMPPVNLRCLEITSSTLLIQWDPPPEGRVSNYALLFQGSGAPSQQLLPAERTLIRLAGLTPDTLYVVRVYTVYHDSHSQYATLFRQTSKVDESVYASEVLQPLPASFSTSQNDMPFPNDFIKGTFHHQRDEHTSNAQVILNNVRYKDKLISNVKQEVSDNDGAM